MNFGFQILIETVSGSQFAYQTASLVEVNPGTSVVVTTTDMVDNINSMPSTSFANMSKSKFSELDIVFKDIELSLKKCFQFNKINYLALMMVDRNPHFHVIPRYSKSFNFEGKKYYDNSWPSPPDLSNSIKLSDKEFNFLHEFILKNWSNE